MNPLFQEPDDLDLKKATLLRFYAIDKLLIQETPSVILPPPQLTTATVF